MEAREIGIPDRGGEVQLGDARLKILPAHYLHSVGNLQVYDPVSRILFSGDMGASVVDDLGDGYVRDFDRHVPYMEGFHQRYMCSNTACRFWANMVRGLDVEMMVPQHGPAFRGREMVNRFLDWISRLSCGVDRITQDFYRVP
jgi:flavorubredoxin